MPALLGRLPVKDFFFTSKKDGNPVERHLEFGISHSFG